MRCCYRHDVFARGFCLSVSITRHTHCLPAFFFSVARDAAAYCYIIVFVIPLVFIGFVYAFALFIVAILSLITDSKKSICASLVYTTIAIEGEKRLAVCLQCVETLTIGHVGSGSSTARPPDERRRLKNIIEIAGGDGGRQLRIRGNKNRKP